jgi:hypothetical protein
MLDVGLTFAVRGAEKNACLSLDKACEVGRDPGLPRAALLQAPKAAAPLRVYTAFTVRRCRSPRCLRSWGLSERPTEADAGNIRSFGELICRDGSPPSPGSPSKEP